MQNATEIDKEKKSISSRRNLEKLGTAKIEFLVTVDEK
jgi:hypothetical protein